jgi:hypothetical protein
MCVFALARNQDSLHIFVVFGSEISRSFPFARDAIETALENDGGLEGTLCFVCKVLREGH